MSQVFDKIPKLYGYILHSKTNLFRLGPSSPLNGKLNEDALVASVQQYSTLVNLVPQTSQHLSSGEIQNPNTYTNPTIHFSSPSLSQVDQQSISLTCHHNQKTLNLSVPLDNGNNQNQPHRLPSVPSQACQYSECANGSQSYFTYPMDQAYSHQHATHNVGCHTTHCVAQTYSSAPENAHNHPSYLNQDVDYNYAQQGNYLSPYGSTSGYHSTPQPCPTKGSNLFNFENPASPYEAQPYLSGSLIPPSTPDPTINYQRLR